MKDLKLLLITLVLSGIVGCVDYVLLVVFGK